MVTLRCKRIEGQFGYGAYGYADEPWSLQVRTVATQKYQGRKSESRVLELQVLPGLRQAATLCHHRGGLLAACARLTRSCATGFVVQAQASPASQSESDLISAPTLGDARPHDRGILESSTLHSTHMSKPNGSRSPDESARFTLFHALFWSHYTQRNITQNKSRCDQAHHVSMSYSYTTCARVIMMILASCSSRSGR